MAVFKLIRSGFCASLTKPYLPGMRTLPVTLSGYMDSARSGLPGWKNLSSLEVAGLAWFDERKSVDSAMSSPVHSSHRIRVSKNLSKQVAGPWFVQ